jgi:TolA-binding protein
LTRTPLRRIAACAGLWIALAAPSARAADPQYQDSMRMVNRYMAQQQFEAAQPILEQLLAQHPHDIPASIAYVEVLLALHHEDAADGFLTQALAGAGDKTDLYRMREKLRRAQGRLEDAFGDILLVLTASPDRAPWANRETNELLSAGLDPAKARKALDSARAQTPAPPNLTFLAAVVAVHEGRGDEALRLIGSFDTETKQSGEAIYRFSEDMFALGRTDLARKAIGEAIERASGAARRSEMLFRAADMASSEGKHQESLAYLDRVIAERAGTAAASSARLKSAEIRDKKLHDPAGALAFYEKIQNDPQLGHYRPTMLMQMADCYLRLGKYDQAARTYREVGPEAFDPEDAELSALRLAEIEFMKGDLDSAVALYQEMADANPRSRFADQAASRYILINKYRLQGGMDDLVKTWGKLEWARLAGDSLQVGRQAAELLKRDPDGALAAEGLLALGEVALAHGNPESARVSYEELVQRYPQDRRRAPEALLRLGILLSDLGRREDALTKFEAVLTDYPMSVQAGDARRRMENLRRDLHS